MRVLAVALCLLVLSACRGVYQPRDPKLLVKADEAFAAAEYAKAAGHYEGFLAVNRRHKEKAPIITRLGECYLGADLPSDAIRAFDRALGERPDESLRWRIIFRRAVAWRMEGDLRRALEGFRSVAAAPPAVRGAAVLDDALHYEHALALYRSNDWEGAQAELARISDQGPYARQKSIRKELSAFTVQVGAFDNETRARDTMLLLKTHAAGSAVRRAGATYVVTAGTFAAYDKADREARRLRGEGFPGAFVIP